MPLHSTSSLHAKLEDPKFREAFVSSRIAQTIATQIRVMRQRNEMSQKDLAHELGTSQNAIYRLENPRAGRPNVSTLQKIANFFGVGLVVRFAPFSEIVDWVVNVSERSIDVPSFENDTGFAGLGAEGVRETATHASAFLLSGPARSLLEVLAAAESASQSGDFGMAKVQVPGLGAGVAGRHRITQLAPDLEQGESEAMNPSATGAERFKPVIPIDTYSRNVEIGPTARRGFSARERSRKRYA